MQHAQTKEVRRVQKCMASSVKNLRLPAVAPVLVDSVEQHSAAPDSGGDSPLGFQIFAAAHAD